MASITPPPSNPGTVSGEFRHTGSTYGVYGVTPVARPAAYTQSYTVATRSHNAIGSSNLSTTAATNVTPFGFTSQSQADAIATQFNLLRTDLLNLKQVVNSLIDDLQLYGYLQ